MKSKIVLISLMLLITGLPLGFTGFIDKNISATLLDHVQITTQIDARGTTRITLLDAFIRAWDYKGDLVLNGQFGITGDVQPDPGQTAGANFIAGGFVRLDPFLNQHVVFPNHWKFLGAVEHGPGWHYDFRTHESYVNYQIGLAFQLKPKE